MTKSNFDLMVIAPHPDDLEIACGGTIRKLASSGKSIVAVDLTRGEMASRGTPEIRSQESAKANALININLYKKEKTE